MNGPVPGGLAQTLSGVSIHHLSPERREELARHLIGVVTWEQILSQFSLNPATVSETVR
jgi:hypothetical protein